MDRLSLVGAAAAAASLLLVGCPPTCEQLAAEGSSIEVGSSETGFDPIADGDVLEAVSGGQGGQHVWGSFRAQGIRAGAKSPNGGSTGSSPVVRFSLYDDDGEYAGWGPYETAATRSGDNVQAAGFTAQLSLWWDTVPWLWPDDWGETSHDYDEEMAAWEVLIADLESRDLRFLVELEDNCGVTVTDERTVRISGVFAGY